MPNLLLAFVNKSIHRTGELRFCHLSHTPANRHECRCCKHFLDQRHKYRHFVPLCRIFQFQLCDPYKGGESTGCLVVLPGPELAVLRTCRCKIKTCDSLFEAERAACRCNVKPVDCKAQMDECASSLHDLMSLH